MEKETMGTVISVTKQWWLKVNRKPVRAHAMDGAAFPHTIKVKYTIDGKDYICRKWIGAGNKVPDKGTKKNVRNTIFITKKIEMIRMKKSFRLIFEKIVYDGENGARCYISATSCPVF